VEKAGWRYTAKHGSWPNMAECEIFYPVEPSRVGGEYQCDLDPSYRRPDSFRLAFVGPASPGSPLNPNPQSS